MRSRFGGLCILTPDPSGIDFCLNQLLALHAFITNRGGLAQLINGIDVVVVEIVSEVQIQDLITKTNDLSHLPELCNQSH